MEANERRELLKSQYLYLNKAAISYDSQFLKMKSWSVTTGVTAIGAAYSLGKPNLLLLGVLAGLLFWVTEGWWKGFQRAYYPSIAKLEADFAKDAPVYTPFQIWKEWSAARECHKWRKLPGYLIVPEVWSPHGFIVITSIALRMFW